MEKYLINREFKIAIKLHNLPAYRICQYAEVDSHWLSKVLNEAIFPNKDDKRLRAIARVIEFPEDEIFFIKQGD